MYDLTHFTLKDMTVCGAALRQIGQGATSMEDVANRIVRYCYDSFVDERGERANAMVRFFITHPYTDLADDLRERVDAFFGHSPDDPAIKCQTLLATIGDNPDWHSRHRSQRYAVLPLTAEIIDVNPMFAQVSDAFGILVEKQVDPDPELLVDLEQKTYNIFHVPEALGSWYISDQADFVVPYAIRSVLGFYGMLPSGNLFTVMFFSKVPISREMVDYFRPLTLNVKMAVLPFDEIAVFAADAPSPSTPAQNLAQYRSQVGSLSQLLDVHGRVVVEQSERIAQVVADLETQLAENVRLRQQTAKAAVAAERRRLARDLHDSVTQALYSQTLYAEAAARQLDSSRAERAREHLVQLKETAQQALREMRLLIFELRPSTLETDGLIATLQARLDAVEARTGIETEVSADGSIQLTAETETGLYWIAQEALNNGLKYAQATRISVCLSQAEGHYRMTVSDDGVGFDTTAVSARSRFGLAGIEERCAQLGWQFSIRSAPGEGTTIQVEVPCV